MMEEKDKTMQKIENKKNIIQFFKKVSVIIFIYQKM